MKINSKDQVIEELKKLLEITEKLMGPGGCPWDKEQTLISMRSSVLEEACEVIEAIDEKNDANLIEELGDLLYNVIFFCTLAEKEGAIHYGCAHSSHAGEAHLPPPPRLWRESPRGSRCRDGAVGAP